jgi:hypothetical protein
LDRDGLNAWSISAPSTLARATSSSVTGHRFERQGGNAAAIKRDLRRQGHELSPRRVRRLLDELGLPRIKRGR